MRIKNETKFPIGAARLPLVTDTVLRCYHRAASGCSCVTIFAFHVKFFCKEREVRPISSLVKFKRGDHICIFYRTETSLLQNLLPYLAAGLSQGDRCFCVQKPELVPRILRGLENLGFNPALEARRGALDIHTDDEFYFSSGRFEAQALMESLEESIREAVASGFSGLRTAGELSWALDPRRGNTAVLCDQLVGYENMVERSFPGKPVIGICQYAAHLFPAPVLRRVVEAHRLAIEETMVGENHSMITLRSGDFLADIVTDRVTPGEAFHYVVQKRGSADVLNWGQEPTMDAAIDSAENAMAEMSSPWRTRKECKCSNNGL